MTDEFPTLEVVSAVCVSWLAFRDWVLLRGASKLNEQITQVASRLEQNQAATERGAAPWLRPLTRTVNALVSGEIGATTARELLSERSLRARRKLTSGAARDLVVCAVLAGSLIYARAAQLEVGSLFFALGIAALVMLLAGAGLRVRLERVLGRAGARVAEAIARRPSAAASGAAPRCRICREPKLTRVASPEALGAQLSALGVVEVFVCPRCGHVTGAAQPPIPGKA